MSRSTSYENLPTFIKIPHRSKLVKAKEDKRKPDRKALRTFKRGGTHGE